jgi:hypothetical protein
MTFQGLTNSNGDFLNLIPKEKKLMPVKTYQKTESFVQAIRYEGGRESALEISKWTGSGSAYLPPTKDDPREVVQIPTIFGPRDLSAGDWAVKLEDEKFLNYKPEVFESEFKVIEDEDQRLIKHARAELSKFPNEEPAFVESIMNAIKGFCTYRGHSGGSAAIAIHMITALLNGDNLTPLTDDPEEWQVHLGKHYGHDYDLWQNKRNAKAISEDGGKTYYLVGDTDERGEPYSKRKMYTSDPKEFEPEIDPDDLLSDDEKQASDDFEYDLASGRWVRVKTNE